MAKLKTIELETVFDSYDDHLLCPLGDFIKRLEALGDASPEGTSPRIRFNFERGCYGSGDTCDVKIIRDETREEAEAREAAEAKAEAAYRAKAEQKAREHELAQLAALKAKYETDI